ncbi:MAG: F0F1 ATP synthase subunit alpha [Candidatus Babeliales bacterium]
MKIKSTDLVSLFEQSLRNMPEKKLEEIGIVVQVGDNICTVYGLTNVIFGELVNFEGGNRGIVFQLDEDTVSIFLLYGMVPVAELEVAKRTGSVFKAPVGMSLLGRVINVEGEPLDGLGKIHAQDFKPVEVEIPGILQRSPVNESLETGIMVIDALVPIGKGQRELLIGNRNTGKTAIAIDTILHQKGKDVLCLYVSIGQRQANLARIVRFLEENGALEYTTIVNAQAGEAVLNQYLAPYVGCTIAEYFRDEGRDVLIVYDDLSNHAIAFREMSLLLRRAPGREAYPGDVFYLHSRLLERAGKLAKGGSMTALPIVQIQGDDITAYIPTNLISITDGQIFLDTQLFNQGIRPAVNAELSVSRVGGAAQTRAIKKMTRALRLELAQYNELLDFAQFGTELDEVSKQKLARGKRAVELLKQPEYVTYSFVDEVLMLFLLKENFLDKIAVRQVNSFATQFVSYVRSVYHEIYKTILMTQDLSDEVRDKLLDIANEFSTLFVPPEKKNKDI